MASKSTHSGKKRLQSLPKCLPNNLLYQGKYEPGDDPTTRPLKSLPDWFDLDLARRGQLFAQKYLYSVAYSNIVGLYLSLGSKELMRFLTWTSKSNTGEKAFNRYLATVLQTVLWYHAEIGHDLNSPFFTSLRNVRRIHFKVGRRVQIESPDLSMPLVEPPEDDTVTSEPLWKSFRSDFAKSQFGKQCRESDFKQEMPGGERYVLSQLDMAQILWDFAAVPFLLKDKLGTGEVGEQDWIGFVHLWAIIGHCLGVSPDYNICLQEDLEDFKDVAQYMLVHNLSDLNELGHENQVMWRALEEGLYRICPLVSLEVILVTILQDLLGIEATATKKHLNYPNLFLLKLQKYVFHPLLRFQFIRSYANWYTIQASEKEALAHFGFSAFDFKQVASKAFY